LQTRFFCASALLRAGDGASVGDGLGVDMSVPAPAAPAGGCIKTRTF